MGPLSYFKGAAKLYLVTVSRSGSRGSVFRHTGRLVGLLLEIYQLGTWPTPKVSHSLLWRPQMLTHLVAVTICARHYLGTWSAGVLPHGGAYVQVRSARLTVDWWQTCGDLSTWGSV